MATATAVAVVDFGGPATPGHPAYRVTDVVHARTTPRLLPARPNSCPRAPSGYHRDGGAGENQPDPSDRLHNAASEAKRRFSATGWASTASDPNRWAQPGKGSNWPVVDTPCRRSSTPRVFFWYYSIPEVDSPMTFGNTTSAPTQAPETTSGNTNGRHGRQRSYRSARVR